MANLGELPELDLWDFLNNLEPIDAQEYLSFQVARMTWGMAQLKREIEELKERNYEGR